MDHSKSELSVIERTFDHIMESARYGRLYQVLSVHGRKAICARCHVRNGDIMMNPRDRLTLERNPESKLVMQRGDFAFQDNGPNPVWSLYKIKIKEE